VKSAKIQGTKTTHPKQTVVNKDKQIKLGFSSDIMAQ